MHISCGNDARIRNVSSHTFQLGEAHFVTHYLVTNFVVFTNSAPVYLSDNIIRIPELHSTGRAREMKFMNAKSGRRRRGRARTRGRRAVARLGRLAARLGLRAVRSHRP